MNEADAAAVLQKLVDVMAEDERKGLPSASSWRRFELCAGSYQLEQEARRLGQEAHSEPTAASERGDRIHAWLAGEQIELSESELSTAQFLAERADAEIKRIFGEEQVNILKEQRLWLGRKPDASGRFDRLTLAGHLALVQDFKGGFSEPDRAEINAQLKVLAVLVGINFPQIKTVIVQIISGLYGVTEGRYDLERLAAAYDEVMATLEAINAPDPAFRPGVEQCQYCPAINICQAVKDLVLPVARQGAPLPDGDRAAKLLDEVELLQNHLDQIRAYYKRVITDGAKIPGWDLVPGAPKREVSDWLSARAKLEEFVDKEQLDKLATYSIPATERLLGAAIGVRGERLKAQYAAVLGDLLALRYPEPSLKRLKGEPKVLSLK